MADEKEPRKIDAKELQRSLKELGAEALNLNAVSRKQKD